LYDPKVTVDTSTSSDCELHFRDPRPPEEIQHYLERTLVTLFQPGYEGSKLVFRGGVILTGCPYTFELRYDAAMPSLNCYTLHMHANWGKTKADNHEYFRRVSQSWYEYWSKPFKKAPAPEEGTGLEDQYQTIAEHSVRAEAHLSDVASVQREILAAMHDGAYFSTAHKEGGTHIRWRDGCFLRADYGESNDTETFPDEASFLAFLRKFYDWETSKNTYPMKAADYDAWKLILRLMNR
jgi:hypothetical protein